MTAYGHEPRPPIDPLIEAIGEVMTHPGMGLAKYEVTAIEAMLGYAVRENVPVLRQRCESELQRRRDPLPELPQACRNCREPIRHVRPIDGAGLFGVHQWIHVRTRGPECGIVLLAGPRDIGGPPESPDLPAA